MSGGTSPSHASPVTLQRPVVHVVGAPSTQVPLTSQVGAGSVVPLSHTGTPHSVPTLRGDHESRETVGTQPRHTLNGLGVPLATHAPSIAHPDAIVDAQPTDGTQLSLVHARPSSHETAEPVHVAATVHTSPEVQTLPSSHAVPEPTGATAQLPAVQLSVVQALPSLHAPHAPPLRPQLVTVLPALHARPSQHPVQHAPA
jgi:hypothetical protein